MTNFFIQERAEILSPVKNHWIRLLKEKEQYQSLLRASQVMLNADEPSIRTYFCAKKIVLDYLQVHQNDPEAFKELGKVHLFSCGGEETLGLAQEALEQSQVLAGNHDPEIYFLLATCHRMSSSIAAPSLRRRLIRRAERLLKLALRYSPPSTHAYRFALAEFYLGLGKFASTLRTLIGGLSASAGHFSDAEVYYELGKFGVFCADTLESKGCPARAQEFICSSVKHFGRALQLHPHAERQWRDDLDKAERRAKGPQSDYGEKHGGVASDLPRIISPFSARSSTFEDGSSQNHPERSARASSIVDTAPIVPHDELLSQLLSRVENQAGTYRDGDYESDRVHGAGRSRSSGDERTSVDGVKLEEKDGNIVQHASSGSQTCSSCRIENSDLVSMYSSLCNQSLQWHRDPSFCSSLSHKIGDVNDRRAELNSIQTLTSVPALAPPSDRSSDEIKERLQTSTKSEIFVTSESTSPCPQHKSPGDERRRNDVIPERKACRGAKEKVTGIQGQTPRTSQKQHRAQSISKNLSICKAALFFEEQVSSRVADREAQNCIEDECETKRREPSNELEKNIFVARTFTH